VSRLRAALGVLVAALAALIPASPVAAFNYSWNSNCDASARFIVRYYTDDAGDNQLNARCIDGGVDDLYWTFAVADKNAADSFTVTRRTGYGTGRLCMELWDFDNDGSGGVNELLYGNHWDIPSGSSVTVVLPSTVDNRTNTAWISTNSNCSA
jgi:hypothetical protein